MVKDRPRYRGMHRHIDKEAGFALWVPSDWYQVDMTGGHHGVIFTPYPDRIDTSFAAEKHVLDYKVTDEDIPTLREGFYAGVKAMPGVEIEWQDETITPTLKVFEARYTFLEDGERRKRWVRAIFWEEGQLVLIAQGASEEEYAYWEGMFYNTMMTAEVT